MEFLEGLKKSLSLVDFTEKEISCLMRVISKPEVDNNIILIEFLQIMQNLGL